MLTYPDIDPVAFQLGPVQVHWYGLMYLVGFLGFWGLGRLRAQRAGSSWTPEQLSDLLFYGALGVVLGGRIGYVLFYDFGRFLDDPLVLFRIWQGGMSFHGGLLGVLIAIGLYGRKTGRRFFEISDFVAPIIPVGLAAGRAGNFINGELWGKVSDLPWAMRLPCARFPEYCAGRTGYSPPHHPSQLYELFLEGVVLLAILWLYSRRPRPTMAVSGLFLLCYGVFRFLIELVRLPDAHIGYLAFGWVTMGQVLSLPMVLAGAVMLGLAYRRNDSAPVAAQRSGGGAH